MKAEIIAIGTEILMGYIVNTNASWLGQSLLDMGIGTYYQQVVGDNPRRIKDALQLASERSDVIIISGGLGPTRDDITKELVGEFLGEELVISEKQLDRVENFFKQNDRQMTELDFKQAQMIDHGEVFYNEVGLACGTGYKQKRADGSFQYYIIVPGPPFEMKHMVEHYVGPYLTKEIFQTSVIESQYINLFGIGEARVAQTLDDLVEEQTNPTIAIYAKPNRVTVRLTANAETGEAAKAMNQSLANQIIERLEPYFIGFGEHYTFEHYIVDQLISNDNTLSIAESLTGGLVMETLTKIPGVSNVLRGGFVTYQTLAKEKLLGIDHDLIVEKTVVSPEIAQAMAENCREICGTDFGLALTGVAGPEPQAGKEPGEVYVALAIDGEETIVKHLNIDHRPRDVVRDIAKDQALNLITKYYANR